MTCAKQTTRRGTAPLEFIFCLVALLPVFAFLLFTGAAMIAKSDIAVVARHKAWKQRFDPTRSKPFDYDAMSGKVAPPAETRKVGLIPLFRRYSGAEARHVVLGNAWDYDQIPLNHQPNWDLYGRLAAQGVGMRLNDLSSSIQNIGGKLESSLFDNDVAKQFQDKLIGSAGQFGIDLQVADPSKPHPSGEDKEAKYKDEYTQDLDRRKKDLQAQIESHKKTIQRLNAELKEPATAQDPARGIILEQRIAEEKDQQRELEDQKKNLDRFDVDQLDKK